MSKKMLFNRLDSFFAEIGQEETALPQSRQENFPSNIGQTDIYGTISSSDQPLAGWTWECDSNYCFTSCGPEVKDILGIWPNDFLGQPITTFALLPDSASRLESALHEGEFPIELTLDYRSAKNGSEDLVPVKLHIIPKSPADSDNSGPDSYQGFTQVILPLKTGSIHKLKGKAPVIDSLSVSSQRQQRRKTTPKLSLSSQKGKVIKSPSYKPHTYPSPISETLSKITAPIQLKGNSLGTLEISDENPDRSWSSDERHLVSQVADQLSLALENAYLYQQEQERRQIADTLREIAHVVGSTLDIHEVIERMLDQLSKLIEYHTAAIYLVYKGQSQLIGGRGFNLIMDDPGNADLWHPISEEPLIAKVVQIRETVLIPDTRNDPVGVNHVSGEEIRSWLATPLVAGQQVVGVLTLDHTQPGAYNQDTAELASAIAAQAAVAIQNARLFQQSQENLAETETLYLASAELNTAQSLDDILEILRTHTVVGQGAHYVSINLFDHPWTKDSKPEWINVVSRRTTSSPEIFAPRYALSSLPSAEKFLRPDSPFLVEDVLHDPRLDENVRAFYSQQLEAKSTLFTPMVVSGQWLGFINASYPNSMTFPESEIRRLVALTNQAAVAMQNLLNIELAEQRAREAQQHSEELAVINRVVSKVVSSPDLRLVLDTMAYELMEIFSVGHVDIALLDERHTNMTIVAERSISSEPSTVGATFPIKENQSLKQIIDTRQSIIISDVQNNTMLTSIHPQLNWREVQSIAILPIITGGEVIGIVEIDILDVNRTFTPQEVSLAETLIAQISTAVQNANLFDQIHKSLAETETLYRASAELNAIQTYDDILAILRKSTILGYPETCHVAISIYEHAWIGEEQPESFTPIARWTHALDTDIPGFRYPLRSWTTTKSLLRPDTPILIDNPADDPRVDKTVRMMYIDRLGGKSLLFAPLTMGKKWIGHINAVFSQSVAFTDQETKRLMALASQAAIAIQNIRLLDETRRRATQLETAAEIARDTTGTLALEDLLARAVNLIGERYGYYHASIFLLDESGENAVVRASTGEAGEEMIRQGHKLAVGSRSIIGYVTEMDKSLVINDVTQNPIHRPNPLLPETRSELGIPLKISNRAIGALDVQSTEINAFSTDDIAVLETLADQIAVAVDNARSYELAQQAVSETRQRVQELSVLFNVSQALASATMESVEIANIVARRFVEITNFPECSISLIDRERNELDTLADLSLIKDGRKGKEFAVTDQVGTRYKLSDYPATVKVIETLLPTVVQRDDSDADPAELAYMSENGVDTLVIIPMAVKGQAIGIIELESKDMVRIPGSDQLNLATILANAAAVALENARLYEVQRRTTEKLREVDKLKSQFLANMSHELRTPLNSIIGFSRVIIKGIDGPTTELQQQDLNAIYSSGQHLLNLINDILDISKIEAGKMELTFDNNVNLADLITSVMSTAIGLVKDKPIKLERVIPTELPVVRADPTRLRQVILNFISNAAKFTEQGSITVEAGVQTGPDRRDEIIVKVTDTGIGISPEDQKKLFLPFSQVDDSPTRKTGGSGLGLSISRLLIEMHGGHIGLISEAGKGSTFYFTLPLPFTELMSPLDKGKKVILAIDDERQIINLYDRYLSEHGYQVLPLTDPSNALERARQVQPFAITLDVMMPGRSGWQVLEELKNDPDTRHIPVIICSILEDQEKGFSLGAADYLTKPILEDDLLNALNRLNTDGNIQEVLVVDDDPDDLRLVERILQKDSQYHVSLALGGSDGLIAIRANRPHAVILDLLMPGMDGFTVLETMRADPALREIPVIIFTAGDINEEQQRRLSQFSQEMLHKGIIDEAELLASIERALHRFNGITKIDKNSNYSG